MKKKFYVGIGDRAIDFEKIVGIFDLDKTTVKKDTREFLNKNEKAGLVETEGFDIPLSFIVTNGRKKAGEKRKIQSSRVILSPISPATLLSRIKNEGRFPNL